MGSFRPLLPLGFLAVLTACGGSPASQIVSAPRFEPKDQTKCGVTKSQDRPLIVEWPSSDRLQLESKTRRSLVAVKYMGCEMAVLQRCAAPGAYRYLGGTRKVDRVEMRDEDDLYANLPIGAAKLEGKLKRSGRLTVDMSLVGRWEAERDTVREDELQGDCEGATHFISGVTVGAFDFFAGGDAEVGGGIAVGTAGVGARSSATRESLTRDGDVNACAKATAADKTPPEGCGALVRIEVVPLAKRAAVAPPAPTCPEGTQQEGSTCVPKRPVALGGETKRAEPPPPFVPPEGPAQPEPPPPPSSSQKTLGYLSAGIGVVGIGIGSIFGLEAGSKWNSAKSHCGNNCYTNEIAQGEEKEARGLATLSTIGFIGGGALAVGGLVLIFSAPKRASTSGSLQVTPSVAPGSAGLSLRGGF